MSPSQADYLRHILDEIDYVLEHLEGMTEEAFLRDETTKRAFVRSLEIIGEATKNLPLTFGSDIAKSTGVLWPACGTA